MKRVISIAIIAMATLSPTTHAAVLNPRGIGQALVYPYYTVNENQATMLSVVNTTARGKALKVRFHEGYDGRDVLDFNVYLSPFDVWVAEVTSNGDGAAIATDDNSCTVPQFPTAAQRFLTFDFDGSNTAYPPDGGPTGFSRTREGHFDVIEMGEVTNATQGTLASITQSNGIPADCSQVVAAWAPGGYWTTDSTTDLTPPGGGLYGTETIINVAQGTMYTLNAEAIDGFSSTIQHTIISAAPDLNTANDSPATSAPNVVTAMVPVGGRMVQAQYQRPEDAISALFMADSLYNEYIVEPSIGAQSDWVVTFPTKRFYVDAIYVHGFGDFGVPEAQPFDVVFGTDPQFPGTSCSGAAPDIFNREEEVIAEGVGLTPVPGSIPQLCFETSVLTFGIPTSVLGSNLVTSADGGPTTMIETDPFMDGHLRLGFNDPSHRLVPSANGDVFVGLPAIGFLAVNFINNNVAPGLQPGVLANYSGLVPHRANVSCTNTANPQGICP